MCPTGKIFLDKENNKTKIEYHVKLHSTVGVKFSKNRARRCVVSSLTDSWKIQQKNMLLIYEHWIAWNKKNHKIFSNRISSWFLSKYNIVRKWFFGSPDAPTVPVRKVKPSSIHVCLWENSCWKRQCTIQYFELFVSNGENRSDSAWHWSNILPLLPYPPPLHW